METHPEEFVVAEGIPAKWDNLIRSYEAILDPEDIALFKQARSKLLQQQFTEKVLEELVDPKKSSLEELLMAKRNATLSVGQTLVPSLTAHKAMASVGQTPVPSTITLEQTLARLREIKKEYDTPKKSKTIFGKLFNYQ